MPFLHGLLLLGTARDRLSFLCATVQGLQSGEGLRQMQVQRGWGQCMTLQRVMEAVKSRRAIVFLFALPCICCSCSRARVLCVHACGVHAL